MDATNADYARTYATDAERYDRLVRAEDADGELARALKRRLPASATVLDVGAGTGRIGRLLGDAVVRGVGVDASIAMLRVASDSRDASRRAWSFVQADVRALPVGTGTFNVATAGWVLGHLREWFPDSWRRELSNAIAEMRRAVGPGGRIVVIDTLGTAADVAGAPTPELGEYHEWLERDARLEREVVRTDYVFESVAEATELMTAFFGLAMANRALPDRQSSTVRVPEFTGIWTG